MNKEIWRYLQSIKYCDLWSSLLVQLDATGIRLNCKGKIGTDQFFPKPTLKTKSSKAIFATYGLSEVY